jgi:hypothetical protein
MKYDDWFILVFEIVVSLIIAILLTVAIDQIFNP